MKTINADELKNMRQNEDDLTVINVLSEKQHRTAHIPGSENVPVEADDFVDRVENLVGSKEKPVVVYCANNECTASPTAAETLEKAGFDQVYDFEAGVKGWDDAGEKLVTSS